MLALLDANCRGSVVWSTTLIRPTEYYWIVLGACWVRVLHNIWRININQTRNQLSTTSIVGLGYQLR
jgi:hypothetical protein